MPSLLLSPACTYHSSWRARERQLQGRRAAALWPAHCPAFCASWRLSDARRHRPRLRLFFSLYVSRPGNSAGKCSREGDFPLPCPAELASYSASGSSVLSPRGLDCHARELAHDVHWTPAEVATPRRAGRMLFCVSLQSHAVSGYMNDKFTGEDKGETWRKKRVLGALTADLGWA